MGFNVKLGINTSPVEKIGKNVEYSIDLVGCVLKEATSVLRPTIMVRSNNDNIMRMNYMDIPFLSRKYFIDDIISVKNGLWEISGHVDPLDTYKDAILANSVILEGTEKTQVNKYLQDQDVFITNCKRLTNIINFPQGLLDTGEFILITAGG